MLSVCCVCVMKECCRGTDCSKKKKKKKQQSCLNDVKIKKKKGGKDRLMIDRNPKKMTGCLLCATKMQTKRVGRGV